MNLDLKKSEQTPEPVAEPGRGTAVIKQLLASSVSTSIFAVIAALLIGAILIAFADDGVRNAASYFFARPRDTLSAIWTAVYGAYEALFRGAVYDWDARTWQRQIRPITETLVWSTPLIFAGLGLGIGFRAGLFNIGAQGQIVLGAVFAGYIGFAMNLPPGLHLLLGIFGAILGGGIWAGIAGWLKATTGANEVIVTIMLNNVAVHLIAWLLTLQAFRRGGSANPISPPILDSALYPQLLPDPFRLHLGFFVALLAAWAVWWLMERSTLGFEFRAVGANPHAARTAGIRVERSYIWVMVIAGALAGLAGSAQVLGTEKVLTAGIAASFGFDAITVALLGRSKPLGIVLSGLLFGALRAGGFTMQSQTGTPIDLILILQSLVVLFIAAPALVRGLFRLPGSRSRKSAPALTGETA